MTEAQRPMPTARKLPEIAIKAFFIVVVWWLVAVCFGVVVLVCTPAHYTID